MYRHIIRPILFLIYPEKVHDFIVKSIKILFIIPGVKYFVKWIYTVNHPLLETKVVSLTFKNPVGLAAGFDKNATFFNEFSNFGFSHIEIGTLTPKPQPGNPKPRSFRLVADNALINRMGFNNVGVEKAVYNINFIKRNLILGGNIGKNTATPNTLALNDYLEVFQKLYDSVDYFVINVSCPNITDMHKLQDQEMLTGILSKIIFERSTRSIKKPVFLKISPDLNPFQVDETIEIVKQQGIDGFVISNTTISRENLNTDEKLIKLIGKGGLSGMPIKDRSTALIKYVFDKTEGKLPIIGVGGIMTAEDAIEKLNAGACLVQIYTGFIYEGPALVYKINKAVLKMRQTNS